MASWRRWSRVGCPRSGSGWWTSVVAGAAVSRRLRTTCISWLSRPHARSRGWRSGVLVVEAPRRRRRVQRQEVDVAVLGQRAGGRRGSWPGRRVRPNRKSRSGRSTSVGSAARARHPDTARSAGLGTPMRVPQASPQLGLPAGVGGQVDALAVTVRRRRPRPGSSTGGGRRSGRRGRRGGARRRTGGRAGRRRRRHRRRRRGARPSTYSQSSSRLASTTSSSGQANRSGRHGSAIGSTPVAAASADCTSRPGKGNCEVGAHAVGSTGGGAESGRQLVGEPALDAERVHGDDLAAERVGDRRRQQVGQHVGQHVGPLGAVEHERHRCSSIATTIRTRTPPTPGARPATTFVGWRDVNCAARHRFRVRPHVHGGGGRLRDRPRRSARRRHRRVLRHRPGDDPRARPAPAPTSSCRPAARTSPRRRWPASTGSRSTSSTSATSTASPASPTASSPRAGRSTW